MWKQNYLEQETRNFEDKKINHKPEITNFKTFKPYPSRVEKYIIRIMEWINALGKMKGETLLINVENHNRFNLIKTNFYYSIIGDLFIHLHKLVNVHTPSLHTFTSKLTKTSSFT